MGLVTILKLALVAGCIWLLYRGIKSLKGAGQNRARVNRSRGNGKPENRQIVEDLVQDPNCGTYLPRGEAIRQYVAGEDHFFCSEDCRDEYIKKAKN